MKAKYNWYPFHIFTPQARLAFFILLYRDYETLFTGLTKILLTNSPLGEFIVSNLECIILVFTLFAQQSISEKNKERN